MSKITVNQVNTSKVREYELHKDFSTYSEEEFKALISRQEMIPTKAIKFVNLPSDKISTGSLMMKELYSKGVVYYRAFHIDEAISDSIIDIADPYIDSKKRVRAQKVYPFSVFATDAMVSMLLETNRLN